MNALSWKQSMYGNLLLGAMACALAGCGVVRALAERSSPGPDRQYGLLVDGGFEIGQAWSISAPPGYGEYARLDFDDRIRYRGRRSAHVAIYRYPRHSDLEALHAWMQRAGAVPGGVRLVFGGWVRCSGTTGAKLSLKIDFEQPISGRTFVSVTTPSPPADEKFHYVERVIRLPEGTRIYLTLHAGLSSLGEAWFDDLFVRIVK